MCVQWIMKSLCFLMWEGKSCWIKFCQCHSFQTEGVKSENITKVKGERVILHAKSLSLCIIEGHIFSFLSHWNYKTKTHKHIVCVGLQSYHHRHRPVYQKQDLIIVSGGLTSIHEIINCINIFPQICLAFSSWFSDVLTVFKGQLHLFPLSFLEFYFGL